MKEKSESLKTKMQSWIGAIAIVALLIWMPPWTMVIALSGAILLIFFPDASIADPDDIAFGFKAVCLGLVLLCAVALFWFFFGNKTEMTLRDVLIPHRGMPFDFRFTLLGWLSIFLGLLQCGRFIFRATFIKQ